MSRYDMFLMGKHSPCIGGRDVFSAATRDMLLRKSLAMFILGSVLLYFADHYSAHGIRPGDIPGVFLRFIKSSF